MITVSRIPEADTRTATHVPTEDELLQATKSHIQDVENGCSFLADQLIKQSKNHDNTKLKYIDEFYRDFVERQNNNKDFKSMSWWKKHLTERHHLNDRVPDDVNLIDVLEMVVDCTMAGLSRSGSVFDISLNPVVLQRAIENTKNLLVKETVLIGNPYEEKKDSE